MRTVRSSPKRPVELFINAQVLDMAQEMGIDISQTVDALLTEEVLRLYWSRWPEANAEAIENYNARIKSEGLPLQRFRTFMRVQAGDDNPT